MDKSESRIQHEIVSWYNNAFCLKHHEPQHFIFSVPNELLGVVLGILTAEGISQRIIKNIQFKLSSLFKSMGLKGGVSDLIILRPGEAIFVEVKTATGIQSPKQKEFQPIVERLGFRYLLVRSLNDFKEKINGF